MIARIRVATAALLSLLSSSGTQDRTLESFDLDAIPYADRQTNPIEFFTNLPSIQRAWRDVRDPMIWVGGRNEALCATTRGSTVRCWRLARTFRETLLQQPWIRRNVRWHSVEENYTPWCVHNADRSVECVNTASARRDGVARRWLTADTVFSVSMSICARTGASVSCLGQRHTVDFELPSDDARIEKLGERTLCSRVGDRLECHWVSPEVVHNVLDLTDRAIPVARPGTTERTLCDFVFEPERQLAAAPVHFSAPWRPESERRSLFLVMPDRAHPDRLAWRRIDEVFTPRARRSPDEHPECDTASIFAYQFWVTSSRMGIIQTPEFARTILGEARTREYLRPPVIFDAWREPDWLFIPRSPSLDQRLKRLFGMIE